MDLTSEQVHWIGGVAFVTISLLMLARASGHWRWRWIPWLVPALFVGYGLESVADVWIHGDAVPPNYAAETRQHLLQGGSLFVAGVVEALVLSGRLFTPIWRLAVPVALAVTATVFAAHAQHGGSADAAAMALMQVQHRGFAIALFTAAAARTAEILMTRSAASRQARGATSAQDSPATLTSAWLLPMLIFGLLMLTYTEPAMRHS